jgi:hypothetical protein
LTDLVKDVRAADKELKGVKEAVETVSSLCNTHLSYLCLWLTMFFRLKKIAANLFKSKTLSLQTERSLWNNHKKL